MRAQAEALRDDIVAIRRDIHQHPELGYRETRTAQRVIAQLVALGLPYRGGIAGTGVVAELKKGEGPTVIIRADMDALPIQEDTDLPYASTTPGVMHACGHDTHVAMGLGAARLLLDADFAGTVRFVFQPAEEGCYNDPNGWSGGQRMVKEGVHVGASAAIALHQVPVIPTGRISIRDGAVMAASDEVEIIVHGRAAHAGVSPQAGIDAIVIAAQLVTTLQTVVARNVGPTDTAVVSIGTIQGGSATNIVAESVRLTGTIRTLNMDTRAHVHARIAAICEHTAAMHGTTIDCRIANGYPVTMNDAGVSAVARDAARRVLGDGALLDLPPLMGGEDFSFTAQAVPSCFALLGTQGAERSPYSLHSPKMIVDEAALPLGAAWLAQTALDLLAHFATQR
ncbi:M20 metallopeptidase family protein [Jeongeupia naejangsanensis]|uniref:Amidohydrolase n=1 Tax=Jeongeupia naejangsanensis TaxID=613195 RepID=A0ABS2BMT3_9NEIS|nr:M20 family metallopeptidase [Jeongeupia naejangsanensis]MBM3116917.1 amidohydrolase [Jeongeupia naejangsanensis]